MLIARARKVGQRAARRLPRVAHRRALHHRGVLAGAGFNAIMPAHAGDAIKVFLAKKSIPGASYPAGRLVFRGPGAVRHDDRHLRAGLALTLGLLRRCEVSELPAFDIAFWADHPELLISSSPSWIGAVVLFMVLSRRAEAFWNKLKQGIVILATPRRYLREVASWQMVGWLCRFGSFWFFLEAFNLDGSAQNVLIVMAVESVAKALPFTPGGAGAQQALLVATLRARPRPRCCRSRSVRGWPSRCGRSCSGSCRWRPCSGSRTGADSCARTRRDRGPDLTLGEPAEHAGAEEALAAPAPRAASGP